MKEQTFGMKFFFHIIIVATFFLASCAHQTMESDTDEMTETSEMSVQDGMMEEGFSGEETLEGEEVAYEEQGEDFSDALGVPSDEELAASTEEIGEGQAETSEQPLEFVEQDTLSNEATQAMASLASVDEAVAQEGNAEGEVTEQEATEPVVQEAPQKVVISHTPKLPGVPVERNGSLLNRYYMLRKNDSPENVSKLIYGNNNRASDLSNWNQKRWMAGSVIFFISPLQPADGNMRSFYEERGMNTQDYVVQKGDTLSTIALDNYGSVNSWKEIGVVNQMSTPDKLQTGMKLALYPGDLSSYALNDAAPQEEQVAQTENLDQEINRLETEIGQLEREISQDSGGALASNTANKFPISDPLSDNAPLLEQKQEDKVSEKKEPQLASFDLNHFIRQNIFFILMGVLATAVLLFYVFTRKAKNADINSDF